MHKLLLIEDDMDYGSVIKQYLEICKFEVVWVTHPKDLMETLDQHRFSLVILDIMLPQTDGFSLSKSIREKDDKLPFLFLTAKNQRIDRLMGLKLGAEDYISKICDPEELKLRIENILKRTAKVPFAKQYKIGDYHFYPIELKLIHPKQSIRLTLKERDLLMLLLKYNNQLVKRTTILNELWTEPDYFNGRSMDVFMSRLRKYLRHDPAIEIGSIRGVGFELNLPVRSLDGID